jgi:hypothetical protein
MIYYRKNKSAFLIVSGLSSGNSKLLITTIPARFLGGSVIKKSFLNRIQEIWSPRALVTGVNEENR